VIDPTDTVGALGALQRAQGALAAGALAKARPAIESAVEALIGLLDGIDGDADFEPDLDDEAEQDHCLAGDDGCGPFIGGQRGGLHWGSDWDGEALLGHCGEYGEDQRILVTSPMIGVGYDVDAGRNVNLLQGD
jgi:hypothetical protein